MKPRLCAPLTREDFDIWDKLSDPADLRRDGLPMAGTIRGDRRDANLMLVAQLNAQYDLLQFGAQWICVRWGAVARTIGLAYESSAYRAAGPSAAPGWLFDFLGATGALQ